jgi:phosphate transport system substrate-binding protein
MAGKGRMPLMAVAAVFSLGLTAACGSATAGGTGSATHAADASVPLTETGSSLLAPLMKTWAGDYHAQVPGVTISTTSSNSGTGIADASAGTADIGTTDAYLSSGDLVKNPALLNIPLVISAQQVNYNVPGFNGPAAHINLDGAVLAAIYQGTVTLWNDVSIEKLNPKLKLPPLPIVPVRRSDSSGDTFLFSSYLSTQDTDWNSAIGYGTTVNWPKVPGEQERKGNMAVVDECAVAVGCVAYAGISYLHLADSKGLGEAALANAAGQFELPLPTTIGASVASFVSSTPPNETISMINGPARNGYPIVNYEYAIVSTRQPDPAKAPAIRAFLSWVIGTGNSARYLQALGFAPLPGAVATLASAQIARIG